MSSNLTYGTTARKFSTHRTLSVTNFLGVDYSSNSLSVDINHAINSKNLLRRDKTNVLQKRLGCKNVYNALDHTKVFNNFWKFIDQNGVERCICNVSGNLYSLTFTNDVPLFTLITQSKVLDQKVSAIPCNNRLYILGGIKYLVVSVEDNNLVVEQVANGRLAYTPTTTIGITPIESSIALRQSLDGVNLLSYWRKNRLVSGTNYTSDSDHTVVVNTIQSFQLDASIEYKDELEMDDFSCTINFYDNNTLDFSISEENNSKNVNLVAVKCSGINISNLDATKTSTITDTKLDKEHIYILVNKDEFTDTELSVFKSTALSTTITIGNTETLTDYESIVNGGQKVYGYLTLDGVVTLFNDYPNASVQSNITVKFPHYNADLETNPIDKCHIGIVYTANNLNSLFVCGNSDRAGTDWHSSEPNSSQMTDDELELISNMDLVYFPDTSYRDIGQNNKNPIIGYDVLGTGDLLILKKFQTYESTIYFRTGTLVEVSGSTDLNGNALYKQEFKIQSGNIGDTAINQQSIVNFRGDTLFVASSNTIQGLDKEEKAYDTQKYSNTRSYYLDDYLKTKDLTDSFFFVDNDYLYFVNGKEVFVNDYGNITNKNYEWFHLIYPTEIKALIRFNNKIYFGDNNGRLFEFASPDTFYDEIKSDINNAGMTTTANSRKISVDTNFIQFVKVNDILISDEYLVQIIGVLGTDFTITDNSLTVLSTIMFNYLGGECEVIYNGTIYSLVKDADSSITTTYTMTSKGATTISATMNADTLYLAKKEFIVKSVDFTNLEFETTEINNFALTQSIDGHILHRENVECNYLTPPYIFGNATYYKNLHSILLTNDKNIAGETSVEYIDDDLSLHQEDFNPKASYGLDLGNFSFENLNMESNRIPMRVYPFRLSIIRKKYVSFNFYNKNDTNCVLSTAFIDYSYGTSIY